MNTIKEFRNSFNKKTFLFIFALVALVAIMFSGLNALSFGFKNAVINTPEISAKIDDRVSASGVIVNVYVATSTGFSNTTGTACGTVKVYADYNKGGTLLSGSGSTSFDIEAGLLGSATKLCGLVA